LHQVWIRTLDDGWLLDVVTGAGQGAGTAGHRNLGASHRTLAQTDDEPRGATHRLVQLLWELDTDDAAGIVTVRRTAGRGSGIVDVGPSPPRAA
jgi:hypothetical protein